MPPFIEFGRWLTDKRTEKEVSLRTLAKELGVSAPYLHDVEKGNRYAPDLEKLKVISAVLHLSREESDEMFNLAGRTRDQIAPDLPEYILNNDAVTVALRTARDKGISNDVWLKFAAELNGKDND